MGGSPSAVMSSFVFCFVLNGGPAKAINAAPTQFKPTNWKQSMQTMLQMFKHTYTHQNTHTKTQLSHLDMTDDQEKANNTYTHAWFQLISLPYTHVCIFCLIFLHFVFSSCSSSSRWEREKKKGTNKIFPASCYSLKQHGCCVRNQHQSTSLFYIYINLRANYWTLAADGSGQYANTNYRKIKGLTRFSWTKSDKQANYKQSTVCAAQTKQKTNNCCVHQCDVSSALNTNPTCYKRVKKELKDVEGYIKDVFLEAKEDSSMLTGVSRASDAL